MKYLFITICIAVTVKLLPRGKNVFLTSKEIEGRLPEGHIEKFCGFSPGGDQSKDPIFWEAIGGVRGLLEFQRVSAYLLKLVQAHRREGAFDLEDASIIWWDIVVQMFFTALAIPEAAFGSLWHSDHWAARRAVGSYCQLLFHTSVLCFSATNQRCPINLPELL